MREKNKLKRVEFAKAYHIKLGKNGCWEKECIVKGIARFGYTTISNDLCQKSEWKSVRELIRKEFNSSEAMVSNRLREIRSFYTASEDDLWITFHGGKLYWGFLEKEVKLKKGDAELSNTKYRKVRDGWSCCDVSNNPIYEIRLRGDLISMKYYRMTIKDIYEKHLTDYLQKIINATPNPALLKLNNLKLELIRLIRGLQSKDFEILVDLIMTGSGIKRETEIGGCMKDIDFGGYNHLTHEYYYVQVKSRMSYQEMQKCLDTSVKYKSVTDSVRYLIFCHTYKVKDREKLESAIENTSLIFFGPEEISDLVWKFGLSDWLISRG